MLTVGGHSAERPASVTRLPAVARQAYSGVINFFSDQTLLEPGLFGIFY